MNSAAKRIHKMNSENIKIVTINDSTHLFPLEVPEKVSEIILDFIK
jgi:pimeloyl-ACP methyl ester carboxylesterase